MRLAVEEQKAKVDKTTDDVNAAVREMREGEAKTRDEMREVRDEVNTIREMLPKVRYYFEAHLLAPHSILADDRENERKPDSISSRAATRTQVLEGLVAQ